MNRATRKRFLRSRGIIQLSPEECWGRGRLSFVSPSGRRRCGDGRLSWWGRGTRSTRSEIPQQGRSKPIPTFLSLHVQFRVPEDRRFSQAPRRVCSDLLGCEPVALNGRLLNVLNELGDTDIVRRLAGEANPSDRPRRPSRRRVRRVWRNRIG